MGALPILRMGHPLLRERARELAREEILSQEIQRLIADMHETMRLANGLGLAAPQVGMSVRLALVEVPENSVRYPGAAAYPFGVYINPRVKVLEAQTQGYWEGCLSVPGLRGYVERARKIEVKYLDENAEPRTLVAEGFPATVFQHEFDHLDGKLFVDRLASTAKLAFLDEFIEFHDPHQGQYGTRED